MINGNFPSQAVSPGRIVLRELEAMEWSRQDLADKMGVPVQTVDEIILSNTQITTELAHHLAEAFGTSSELWVNLDMAFQFRRALL